jgi:hypothetical protein
MGAAAAEVAGFTGVFGFTVVCEYPATVRDRIKANRNNFFIDCF